MRRTRAVIALVLAAAVAACSGEVTDAASGTSSGAAGAAGAAGASAMGGGGAGGAPPVCDPLGAAESEPEMVFKQIALGITASGGRVQIAGGFPPAIVSIAPDGSDLQTIAPTDSPLGLAITGSNVAWVNNDPMSVESIRIAPLAGGPSAVLVQLSKPFTFIGTLAADEGHVYFTRYSGRLEVRSTSGAGAIETLANPGEYAKIAADGIHVYVGSSSRVFRVPIAGGTEETLYDSGGGYEDAIGGIALDHDDVYFSIGGSRSCDDCCVHPDPNGGCTLPTGRGRVMRVAKRGGKAEVVADCIRVPTAVALDDQFVFVLDAGEVREHVGFVADAAVISVPKAGGARRVLVRQKWPPLGALQAPQTYTNADALAVDEAFVYFTMIDLGVGRAPR